MDHEKVMELLAEGRKVAAAMAAEKPYSDGKRFDLASQEKGRQHMKFSLLIKEAAGDSYDVYLEKWEKSFKDQWNAVTPVVSSKPLASHVAPDDIVRTVERLTEELRRDSTKNFGFQVPRTHPCVQV